MSSYDKFSFSHLMQEGKKIKTGLKNTASKAFKALNSNSKLASDQNEAKNRLSICNKCPNLNKDSGRCSVCGCFVFLKVKLDFEECPVGKW